MDYTRFTFSAVVDWIEVEFTTATATNAQTIRRRCGITGFVTPCNAEESGAASVFRVRLQDPRDWQDVTKRLHQIAAEFPFLHPATVTGIEISLDARSKTASREELVELTARLYKFSAFIASKNHRYGSEYRGGVKAITGGFDQIKREIGRGRVIVIGNQRDDSQGNWTRNPISQRIYFKTTDNGLPLDLAEHRARIEVTLQDDGLPGQSLQFWEQFNFSDLTEFFRFRQIKPNLPPGDQLIADRLAQIGERTIRNRREGGTRLHGKFTSADITLNKRAKDALRHLSKRWSKVQRLRK